MASREMFLLDQEPSHLLFSSAKSKQKPRTVLLPRVPVVKPDSQANGLPLVGPQGAALACPSREAVGLYNRHAGFAPHVPGQPGRFRDKAPKAYTYARLRPYPWLLPDIAKHPWLDVAKRTIFPKRGLSERCAASEFRSDCAALQLRPRMRSLSLIFCFFCIKAKEGLASWSQEERGWHEPA